MRDNPPNPAYRPGLPPYDELLPAFTTDRPEALQALVEMRRVLDEHRRDEEGLLIAELYLPIDRLVRYYGERGDGVHMPSNMHLISTAYRAEEIAALVDGYEAALPEGAWPNWVLGNHDRSRIATRVGPGQARVAAVLLLTLRGTPILYYGDELGMRDVAVPDALVQDPYALRVPGIGVGRDPERSPMQWSSGPNAGFCPPNVTPWLPVPADAARVNVESEKDDPRSMLSLYRRLIALRRAEPALSIGCYTLVSAQSDLLAYRRRHGDRAILVALNLGDQPGSLPISSAGEILLDSRLERIGEPVVDTLLLRGDESVVIAES